MYKMYKISVQNRNFSGVILGLPFSDGDAETNDARTARLMVLRGYEVEPDPFQPTTPDPEPITPDPKPRRTRT